jgi:DMSO/TMAO reductase YedYZ molybdopterin-dependent catalytic subunit
MSGAPTKDGTPADEGASRVGSPDPKPQSSPLSLPQLKQLVTRRNLLLAGGGVALAALAAENATSLSTASTYQPLLDVGDGLGRRLQRLGMWRHPLAPEYRLDQISRNHPSTGGFGERYIDPDPAYDRMVVERFRSWRLAIEGLVRQPRKFTLDELREMPTRTQITMHSCDAGWSAIGQWSGVRLGWLLAHVGLLPQAKYIVFHAMDKIAGQPIFDSIDLFDAFHPQTLLAHRFNGADLPVRHGAPLRLRLELQIGYKNLKHIERISVVDSLAQVARGRGGFYQSYGYQWYAGQ